VSRLFNRFEPVMKLILREMLTAIYWDAAEVEDPSGWNEEDLYARLTFFEHNVHMRNQVESYRALIVEDEDDDNVLAQFKSKSGKAFKAMLDPSTRLLRGMIFRCWAGHTKACIVLRRNVQQIILLRMMTGLKRKCFSAMITNIKMCREEKLKLVKEISDPFEHFAHQHRHYAGAVIRFLEERAPQFFKGPVNSPGGLFKHCEALIYKGDLPDWVDKKEIQKRLRLYDEVKVEVQKECPVCEDRKWLVEHAKSIGTQTEGDEKNEKKKRKKKAPDHKIAPLPVDTVMTLIGEIYDSVVVHENKISMSRAMAVPYTQLTLHELVRDFLIRKYGIRTLANKNFQGLVNCIGETTGNERIDTFAELFADTKKGDVKVQRRGSFVPGRRVSRFSHVTKAVTQRPPTPGDNKDEDGEEKSKYSDDLFHMFSSLLATVHSQIKESTSKISITFNSKEKQVNKIVFILAAKAALPGLQEFDEGTWIKFCRKVDELPTMSPAGTSSKMKREKETIHIDAAIFLILPYLKKELKSTAHATIEIKMATRIQKAWRMRKDRIEFASKQQDSWIRVFSRIDIKMHPRLEHRNCFTYDEFCMLIEMGTKRVQSEELVMILFNTWHMRCDEMLLDELDERRMLMERNMAATIIQRQMRIIIEFAKKKQLVRSISSRGSLVMNLEAAQAQLTQLLKHQQAVVAIEKMFVFTVSKIQTEEEAAIALENARGPVAAEAFGYVMANYGFACPD